MSFVELRVKNQFMLVKTIDFSLLVQQKSSVESSINDNVLSKKVSNVLIIYVFLKKLNVPKSNKNELHFS